MNDLHEHDSDQEISWFFNDVNLTMVIIVLFFAILFASMISQSQGMQESTVSDIELKKERPDELSAYEYFGQEGFPKMAKEKGFPSKERFNEDLILIEQTSDTIRPGMAGNLVWDFENLANIRDRELVLVQVSTEGIAFYESEEIALVELQSVINEKARENNIFVRIHIDPNAPVYIYESIREQLWNQSEAIHWQFSTQPLSTEL